MEDSARQTPATLNQIEQTKPAVKRSFNKLSGHIAGSFNAGHNRTFMYREVMAGEEIGMEGAHLYIQTLTPKTPAYQRLKAVVDVYHVPHVRVWSHYADFAAQGGGSTEVKYQVMPNFEGKTFPIVKIVGSNNKISFQETTAWRDSFASSYIPRMGLGTEVQSTVSQTPYNMMPPMNALLLRGSVAIYNDMLRNKEYAPMQQEFRDNDTVTATEWNSYLFTDTRNTDYFTRRARRDNSYYTNYRTELQGFNEALPDPTNPLYDSQTALLNFAQWEHLVAEGRSQAENAQKNAWDIMQEIRGKDAPKLTQGRVSHIGRKTFPINYSAITQNAYNNNSEIEEKFRVMGFQGAFSYTDIELNFINGIKIEEDGYLHFVITITADTVFNTAVDRGLLNIHWTDRYRPDLEQQKNDVLYKIEMGTPYLYNESVTDLFQAVGFKRKFNENFKCPNVVFGDIQNRGYFETNYFSGGNETTWGSERILPNDTYQFFEESASTEYTPYSEESSSITTKRIWLDYSDLMINKNLAIPNEIYEFYETPDEGGLIVGGQNQFMYVGEHVAVTNMPISEEIKNNFEKWGEW